MVAMRHTLIFIALFFISTNLLSQNTKKQRRISSWRDTTFITVVLKDTVVDTKIVAVDIGKKATIYVKLKPLIIEAEENLSNDFVRDEYKNIIRFFDSASAKGDTIFIDKYYTLESLDYLISHQLTDGQAKVYYKKQKTFVDTIAHRLERYGGTADRFFYLPDKRPFFAVTELTGILVKEDNLLSTEHYEAYLKEAKKLASLQTE
jgi:hypothetical protein